MTPSEAYGPRRKLSTNLVSSARWTAAVAALALVCAVTAVTLIVVLSGGADDGRGYRLAARVTTDALVPVSAEQGYRYWRLDDAIPLPVRIEATLNDALPGQWGLWVGARVETARSLLVDPSGYVALGVPADWRPFIHVRDTSNRITLEITHDRLRWRVNDELVADETLVADGEAQIGVLIAQAAERDITIAIYTPDG